MDASHPENWLHAEHILCPACQEPLFRVDHSPMADDWLLYCEQCANRVEVSFYDPVATALFDALITQQHRPASDLMQAIEQRLKPCHCGGRYRHDAPRRCHRCLAEVLTDAAGVDLWPGYYDVDVDEREPTEEEIALVGRFEANHLRRTDLWNSA